MHKLISSFLNIRKTFHYSEKKSIKIKLKLITIFPHTTAKPVAQQVIINVKLPLHMSTEFANKYI